MDLGNRQHPVYVHSDLDCHQNLHVELGANQLRILAVTIFASFGDQKTTILKSQMPEHLPQRVSAVPLIPISPKALLGY